MCHRPGFVNLLISLAMAVIALAAGCQRASTNRVAVDVKPRSSESGSSIAKTLPPAHHPPSADGAQSAATAEAVQPPAPKQPRIVTPFDGVTLVIDEYEPGNNRVELKAYTCLDAGWLEQIACGPASREHESLVVIPAKPSHVHAALLMAGFKPGEPGRWELADNYEFIGIDPTGEKLDVFVRYIDPISRAEVEHDVRRWIRNGNAGSQSDSFPDLPWVFGGSIFAKNPEWMEPKGGEHYVADMTGSIIGLVTFGDEVIGFSRVMSDAEAVQEPVWEARIEALPPVGTPVTVVLRAHRE